MMAPFWIDSGSVGKPSMPHCAIVVGDASVASTDSIGDSVGLTGISF